ncbi:hypothetical protein SAY86_008749 [Trapa natans]|uniref:Peptidase A1 domain-containing protein n=1 Tax=Trapa natans TaxID=22666 RepID=A0AAN7KFB9_TRANT|nr:hypothetical protein SAY86_008749 [Trapa natans]
MSVRFTDLSLTICAVVVVVFHGFCIGSSQAASEGGFSIELIHRDSPRSPFYDPSEDPSQRLQKSLSRTTFSLASRIRLNALSGGDGSPFTVITPNDGSYLMNISIGTPPVQIIGVADTGSDLIWTQCKPCTSCYKQLDPLFDPSMSSTYRNVACSSSQCTSLDQTSCNDQTRACHYSYSYGDQSYTNGNVAVDTITLASTTGQTVAFPKTLIGCGHDDQGLFNDRTSGIIGLGLGPVSLISQMGQSTGGRFSYCLAPFGSESSLLNFGTRAYVSGSGTVTTPFMEDSSARTFYYLTLEGFTVGDSWVPLFRPSASAVEDATSDGNIIIDSGTTLTYLDPDTFRQLSSEVASRISHDPMTEPPEPLQLCYENNDITNQAPTITAHFSGADVKLSPLNTFVKLSETVICLAFVASNGDRAIYGNIAQSNFHVGYDLENKTVSFKPTDCSRF